MLLLNVGDEHCLSLVEHKADDASVPRNTRAGIRFGAGPPELDRGQFISLGVMHKDPA
jgi:hypothetical protein